jgi:hypothetical protein
MFSIASLPPACLPAPRKQRFFRCLALGRQPRQLKSVVTHIYRNLLHIPDFFLVLPFGSRDTITRPLAPRGRRPHAASPTDRRSPLARYVRTLKVPSSNGTINEYVRVVEA